MSHQENSSNHRTQKYFFMGLLIDSNCLQVLRLEPYMGEDVPVRWFNFERVVEALVQQKIFYLKVSQLYFIVSKTCLIEDEAEMVAMLDFYHDLGIIIWHGDTVVLQTQWLIHLFRKLITIRPFDEQVYCWPFRKDSILLFDTVKPFLLDTSSRRSNKLVRHLVQEKQQARAQGFSSNLVEQMRGRDSLASEGWEGKGSWEEVEGKKQEILRAQNHFRASRDGSISGPLNLVLLNCHHFKNLLPAILRQNVSNILQKFSKIYHSGDWNTSEVLVKRNISFPLK